MLRIGCGPFSFQSEPTDSISAGRLQGRVVEFAQAAEAAGFDSCWLSEHHFSNDGYLSSVLPSLAAIAATTDRLTLGTRVILAPLYNPLRLAEDAAQVALLAHGNRIILGVGLGYRISEFESLGVPMVERVSRMVEAIEVCRKAWTGETFSHSGPTFNVTDLICRPSPVRPPEIWIGARAAQAVVRAAKLGDGLVMPSASMADLRRVLRDFDAATSLDRQPLPITTSVLVACMPGRDGGAKTLKGLNHAISSYAKWRGSGDLAEVPVDQRTSQVAAIAAGSPLQVISDLESLANLAPGREHHLVLRVDYPGMDAADILEHIRFLGAEVLPGIRAQS